VVTKKGTIHLRVVFFYYSFTEERKETIQSLAVLKARRSEVTSSKNFSKEALERS
jgi:hypothetical protein